MKARFGDSKLKTNLKGSGCDTKNFFWLSQEVLSNNLVLRSVSGNFVPRQMTAKQKQHLLSAAFSFLKCAEADENLFKNAVTVDKTWVYRYDPKTKHLLSNC